MIAFFTIFLILIYACFGILLLLLFEAILEYNPNFFGKALGELEETNKIIIGITFWPIFFVYVIGWCIVWYISHLIIAFKSLFNSINIKK